MIDGNASISDRSLDLSLVTASFDWILQKNAVADYMLEIIQGTRVTICIL